jgi:hypothetical protein
VNYCTYQKCLNEAPPGFSRCQPCRDAHNAKRNTRRASVRAMDKAYSDALKTHGVCLQCRKADALKPHVRCSPCLDAQRDSMRTRRATRRQG